MGLIAILVLLFFLWLFLIGPSLMYLYDAVMRRWKK